MRRVALAGACFATRALAQGSGTMSADRTRLAEITGDTAAAARFASDSVGGATVMRAAWNMAGLSLRATRPVARVNWNSALPYSLNDGPLWASRGLNVSLSGGVAASRAVRGVVIRGVLAPTFSYSENRPFQIFSDTTTGRSTFANPHHDVDASLDWPLRFGDVALAAVDPGSSELSVEWPRVAAGATTSSEWWGPGIRNALILSNNAAGVPRLFVKTTHAVPSRVGQWNAELFSGVLTQSRFFDSTLNENRTLSALRVEWRPWFDTTLTIGVSRVVYAAVGPEASPFTASLSRALDAVGRWEFLTGHGKQRSDQIGAVDARWVIPAAGFEVYGEWARMALPESATELLVAPDYSGAWTLGFQWAQQRRRDAYLRLQVEFSDLEQSNVYHDRDRPTTDFYSGQAALQGYTQRGQILGAAIGPGASSQWIAVDWLPRRWQLGAFIGRIRWDNDAMYRHGATFWDHDFSILGGVRGGWRGPGADVSAELTLARRYNYLFQNGIARPGGYRTVDLNNLTLALVASPR
jgi:hypothetical protein